jgi:hypothetical protein
MFDIGIFDIGLLSCIDRNLDRIRRSLVLRIRRTFLSDTVLEIFFLRLHVFFHENIELFLGHDLFEVLDREGVLWSRVGFP